LGRKVHPYGFRLGVIRDWKARWYAEGQEYADLLHEDLKIRRYIQETSGRAGISNVEIERSPNQVSVTIWTARPGIIIGRKGAAFPSMCRRFRNPNWMPSWWRRT
jgi:small subunit ribosomal protein S3